MGFEPTSRAHEAREEAAPPPRCVQVWPAGVEPAISGSRNRRGGRLPYSQTKNPRRDSNPRFRAENPASLPLDHGGVCIDQSEVLESNQALLGISEPCRHGHRPPMRELRRQGSNLLFAINSRASYPFDHTGTLSGRRGSRTLNGRSRTRFRDGIPRLWQPFRTVRTKWPRQESNLHRAD